VRTQFNRLFLFICILAISAHAAVHAKSENFRTSDGVSLHYFDAGSGPAIVFIPGWTMPADIFEPQINELSKQFRIVALDPRSQGDSEKAAEGNNPERHAKDIKELLDHLKLHNVVLLGWSNGVPDVLTFVEQNGSADLRGLILVDGFVKIDDPQMQSAMNGMLKKMQADRAKFTDGFVRSMYATKPSEEYIQHVEEQSLKTPTNTAVTEMYNVVSKGDYTPALAKFDKPVLYICEPYLEFESKVVQTVLPDVRVEVFKNVAHALFVDDPDHFNKVVGDFVTSLAGSSGDR
jgi:non-heme chloroperoxidase